MSYFSTLFYYSNNSDVAASIMSTSVVISWKKREGKKQLNGECLGRVGFINFPLRTVDASFHSVKHNQLLTNEVKIVKLAQFLFM